MRQLHMQGSGTSQQAGSKVTRAAVRRVIGKQEQELHLEKPMLMFDCKCCPAFIRLSLSWQRLSSGGGDFPFCLLINQCFVSMTKSETEAKGNKFNLEV